MWKNLLFHLKHRLKPLESLILTIGKNIQKKIQMSTIFSIKIIPLKGLKYWPILIKNVDYLED
jgi:hypothetical protein